MELHHVGIVVDDMEAAIPLFEVWMGAKRLGEVMEDEAQGARVQLLQMNNSTLLELIEAIPGEQSPLHTKGEFHLCYTVPDLDAEMLRLHEFGAVIVHPIIHTPLFANRRIAFLATHSGQLLELLEDPTMITH